MENAGKFLSRLAVKAAVLVQNRRMEFALSQKIIFPLPGNDVIRSMHRCPEFTSGRISFFRIPVRILILPEVKERTENSSEMSFRLEFSLPGSPFWNALHAGSIRHKINQFHRSILFFSMKQKNHDFFPSFFFQKNRPLLNDGGIRCRQRSAEITEFYQTVIFPFRAGKNDLMRFIPPPFQADSSGEHIFGFLMYSTDRLYSGGNILKKSLSALSPEKSSINLYVRASAVAEDSHYRCWLETDSILRRCTGQFSGSKIRICGDMTDSETVSWNGKLHGYFGNQDRLPDFLSENFTVCSLTKNLTVRTSEHLQSFYANRIYYAENAGSSGENSIYRAAEEILKCRIEQEGKIYVIPHLLRAKLKAKNTGIEKFHFRNPSANSEMENASTLQASL